MGTPDRINGVKPETAPVNAAVNGHRVEGEGKMVFSPKNSADVVVKSPEELVEKGFSVHENAIEETWGKEGVDRYKEARGKKLAEGLSSETPAGKMNV